MPSRNPTFIPRQHPRDPRTLAELAAPIDPRAADRRKENDRQRVAARRRLEERLGL